MIQNLVAGDYTFEITDAKGCSITRTETVTAIGSPMAATLTQTPVICDNMGQIGVSISGGDGGYTVSYSGPVSGSISANSNGNNTGDASISNLQPGNYIIVAVSYTHLTLPTICSV